MPRVTWTKRSFARGELSPQICQSRTDLPLYAQGVSSCLNLIPFRTGALSYRPNTVAYPDLKLPDKAIRLIPFYLKEDTHVLCVFGEYELPFVLVEGGEAPKVTKTSTTPYSLAESEQLDYALCGNLMVLVHRSHPPHKIELTGEGFTFSKMEFSPPPWLGKRIVGGALLDAKLTVIKPKNYNKPCEVTADGNVFKLEDRGRHLRLGFHPKSWEPKTAYSENSFISMYGKVYQSTTAGISGPEWEDNQKDSFIKNGGIVWKVVCSNQRISFGSKGPEQPVVSTIPPYYVWGVIQEVRNANSASVVFSSPCTFTADSVTDLWHLSAWGGGEGYPHHVTFYQNRLVFSGAKDDESSFYLSEYQKFNNFSPDGEYGVPDYLKALSLKVTDDVVREIRWITPMGSGLLIGCDSSLWFFRIHMERGFNVITRRISGSGVYSCPPLPVGDSLLFVCGAGRKIKALSGDVEQGFKFTDVTQFVDHFFKFRIKQMVYQEDPYSLIWVIDRSLPKDNLPYDLFGCRFNSKEDDGYAWHTHKIGGNVLLYSLATFPSVDRGETYFWLLVGRINKNSFQLGLEKLERFHARHNYYADGVNAYL